MRDASARKPKNLEIRGQMVCERGQKNQPAHTGRRHQHAENSGQKGRPEYEIANQETIGPEERQAADFVGSEVKEAKNIIGASHKAAKRRDQ
jgi:hypothetical protein